MNLFDWGFAEDAGFQLCMIKFLGGMPEILLSDGAYLEEAVDHT